MGKFKALHSCVAPEHLLVNSKYSISINPSYDPQDLKSSIDALYKVLNKCDAIEELVLYPEHSPIGRLHYHGYINVMDKYHFYSNDIHMLKSFGTFEIDSIDKPDVWLKYCTKNEGYMKPHVVALQGRSYPLLFKSVDAIMHRRQKEARWAERREQSSQLIDNLHLVFDHIVDGCVEDD